MKSLKNYLKDTDQNERELLTDLFNMLEYEENGRLPVSKMTLLISDKFGIHLTDQEAREMIQALGVKRGGWAAN